MDLREIGWGGVDWTGLAWLRISTGRELLCECGNESSWSITFWESIEWLNSWWALE
jgi:hypothetical protein